MKTNQSHKRIAAAFDRLFRTYGPQGQGSTPEEVARDRIERIKVYFDAVALYDEQDVESAVDAFLSGTAPGVNPAFAPPAPAVGAECRRQMNLRLDRERDTRPALPPPDIEHTADSQERVRAMMASITQKLAEPVTAESAEAAQRSKDHWAKVNQRFAPDMSEKALAERLHLVQDHYWTAGDEGEAA